MDLAARLRLSRHGRESPDMRPLIIVAIVIAIAFMASAFLVGCAQRYPGSDQCSKCYLGLKQVLAQ